MLASSGPLPPHSLGLKAAAAESDLAPPITLPRHGSSSVTLEHRASASPRAAGEAASPSSMAEGVGPAAPGGDATDARPNNPTTTAPPPALGAIADGGGGGARKLVVLGLPWESGEASLFAHFSEYGTVTVRWWARCSRVFFLRPLS